MPEQMITWENEFTSDRWNLKVDGKLVGYYEPSQNATGLYDVHAAHDQTLFRGVEEAEARKNLYDLAVKNG